MTRFTLDEKLLRKYDTPTSRYTSYPAVDQFHSCFGEAQYTQHAKRSNATLLPRDLSIYIRIPFCHPLCYFCGCNEIVTQADGQKIEDYLERLMTEIAVRSRLFSDDRLVTQIHFGGCSANVLQPNQLTEILQEVATQFHLDLPPNLDISIKLDPRNTSPSNIIELSKIGFNRFNIEVQDFSASAKLDVTRNKPETNTLTCIAEAMSVGKSVNVHLVTGLPAQTAESFEATLRKVIETGVARIATHNFTRSAELIEAKRLTNQNRAATADIRLRAVQLSSKLLLDAGYQHIGMDHYALPQDRLAKAQKSRSLHRNFQGYSTHRNTDLIGFGIGAISKFDTAFSQNTTNLSSYREMIANQNLPIAKGIELTLDDRLRASVIQGIMCHSNIDLSQKTSVFIKHNNSMQLFEYFKNEYEALNEFINDELISRTQTGFDISEQGRYFLRPIAAVFDRYLNQSPNNNSQIVQFSRVT